jgi:hypothetical protein
MTFPRLCDLSAYWREHPPLRLQIAGIFQALLGVSGVSLTSGAAATQEDGSLDDLVANFQAAGGAIG